MSYTVPSHLPRRLTISFPIWLLFGTYPDSPYYDLDRLMLEHKERGFNCIRFEDGAGLLFDPCGVRLPELKMQRAFGKYDVYIRQMQGYSGMSGDLLARLTDICKAAKRHGMTIILSTWYYLHTYWRVECEKLNDSLFAILPHEVFTTFAVFLDQILVRLEEQQLDDCIAFCEVMNEADGLEMVGGYNPANRPSADEIAQFRGDHEAAIAMLRERHPQLLFAYDSFTPRATEELIPRNMQVYNFHNYFLWGIFRDFKKEMGESALVQPDLRITVEDIRAERVGHRPTGGGWAERIEYYLNLAPDRIPQCEQWFFKALARDYGLYMDKLRSAVAHVAELAARNFPDVPIVTAEGVAYEESVILLWEEHCPLYWQLLLEMADVYRDAGFWGMTPRTCSGPEDPSWYINKNELYEVNRRFLT